VKQDQYTIGKVYTIHDSVMWCGWNRLAVLRYISKYLFEARKLSRQFITLSEFVFCIVQMCSVVLYS